MSCWRSDYTWREPAYGCDLKKIMLFVVFDHGTQCQFSRVRITLLCSDDITSENYKAMQITPEPLSFSVVDCSPVSGESPDIVATRNNASLPICDVVFMVVDLQENKFAKKICGKLVLCEPGFPKSPNKTIFEFDHILTNNTQSVSISFTSSHQLYTMIVPGVFSDVQFHLREKVGHVVRILPVVPRSHQSISLHPELLLVACEYLYFHQPRLPNWRKDILSCALVCRRWTCALDLLLVDFRHELAGRPLEIISLSRALVQRPNLGLGIKQLSTAYFRRHPTWQTRIFMNPSLASFLDAFATVLRLSRNVEALSLDVECGNSLAEILHGLDKLQIFECKLRYTLDLDQILSYIATWPSLKHLHLVDVYSNRSPSGNTIPSVPLSCHLTEIKLENVPIKNNELVYLLSTSGSTLRRLEMSDLSDVTNAGLAAALKIVCTSLTKLRIWRMPIQRTLGEEYALDAAIARMEHLTELMIGDNIASVRMLERRTSAFEARNITEVYLRLRESMDESEDSEDEHMPYIPKDRSLLDAVKRPWAGWKMYPRYG